MSTHFILKANPTEVGGACGVHGLGHGPRRRLAELMECYASRRNRPEIEMPIKYTFMHIIDFVSSNGITGVIPTLPNIK